MKNSEPTSFQPDREVGDVTNRERAESVINPIAQFGRSMGLQGETLELIVSDFLCNVTHLATAVGYEGEQFLEDVHRRALGHWEAEAKYEPREGNEEPPFLEEPVCPKDELLSRAPRYYLVSGRIPEDDDDTTSVIVINHGDELSPATAFIEELYAQSGAELPEDWEERDPTRAENRHGSWGIIVSEEELTGPETDAKPPTLESLK